MNGAMIPDWPAPAGVRALMSTRQGGVSTGPYASMNLGLHVGDDPLAVAQNRERLRAHLPAEPLWLDQVHGTAVVDAATACTGIQADAAIATQRHVVCAVQTADCLPVLICDIAGSRVAAAHAGWRGLAAGVLEATVQALKTPPDQLLAWLGPAIGPQAFEVGAEVRLAFMQDDPRAASAFVEHGEGKWLANIFLLATQRLKAAGVRRVYGGGLCTFSDAPRWFSYRRDKTTGPTGRMAALIWIE